MIGKVSRHDIFTTLLMLQKFAKICNQNFNHCKWSEYSYRKYNMHETAVADLFIIFAL